MKRILILTSIKTGSGHRSSSNAIEKKLIEAGYETKQLNVFPLMGKTGVFMEDSYIPLTTGAPFIYYLCQRFSEYFPWFIHSQMYLRIRKNLLQEISEFKPDLIISVQCMFTRSISYLLRKQQLKIPFYVGVIDLMDPPSVWRDKKADMTFVPSEAIRDDYLRRGFDPAKVLVSGFPVRDDIIVRSQPKKAEKPYRLLMINTSTDLQKNIRFLEEVLRLKDVEITFVCGLDEKLHAALLKLKAADPHFDKVKVLGFIGNINELLDESHIILTKAGPNVIVEAIRSGTAIVITGHIHGQEDQNYRYVVDNGYGIRCEDPEQIYDELEAFISSGRLQKTLSEVVNHKINNGAEVIAGYVVSRI